MYHTLLDASANPQTMEIMKIKDKHGFYETYFTEF